MKCSWDLEWQLHMRENLFSHIRDQNSLQSPKLGVSVVTGTAGQAVGLSG